MTSVKRRVSFCPSTFSEKPDDDSSVISSAKGVSYIDKLITRIEDAQDLNPYFIDGSILKFAKTISSFEVKILDGELMGLKTLRRSGFCYMREAKGRKQIGANVEAGTLRFRLKVMVKCMSYCPTLTVDLNVAYAQIYLGFSFNSETGSEVVLHYFKISDFRGIDIELIDLGIFSWYLNIIISSVKFLLTGYIRAFIENNVRIYLNELIPTLNFLVEENSNEDATCKMKSEESFWKDSLKEKEKQQKKRGRNLEKYVPELIRIHQEENDYGEENAKSEVLEENNNNTIVENEPILKNKPTGILKNTMVKT